MRKQATLKTAISAILAIITFHQVMQQLCVGSAARVTYRSSLLAAVRLRQSRQQGSVALHLHDGGPPVSHPARVPQGELAAGGRDGRRGDDRRGVLPPDARRRRRRQRPARQLHRQCGWLISLAQTVNLLRVHKGSTKGSSLVKSSKTCSV